MDWLWHLLVLSGESAQATSRNLRQGYSQVNQVKSNKLHAATESKPARGLQRNWVVAAAFVALYRSWLCLRDH